MPQNEQNKEKLSFSDSLSNFLVKFRFLFLGIIVAALAAVVILAVVLTTSEKKTKEGLAEIDAITYELSEARSTLADAELSAAEDALFARAEALLAANSRKVIAVRASMIEAEIHFGRSDFKAAREAWLAAATADEKAYTSPICFYQCGICSEELGELDAAVEYLQRAADAKNFAPAPRALFNIGRIEETRGNAAKAAEAYNKLSASYPSDPWASLGKTRLLSLEAEGAASFSL